MTTRRRSEPPASSPELSLTRSLHTSIVGGVLVVNARGQITSCTPEVRRLFGLPLRTSTKLLATQLPATLQKILRAATKTRTPVTEHTVTFPSEGNVPVTLHLTVVSPASKSDVGAVVIVIRDLTRLQQIEDTLHRLDRLATIGTCTASLGHEIKNALVAIKTFVELLVEKNPQAELAGVVQHEMRRIDSLVSQMLKFARPARPTFAVVRLHEILDHSLRLVQPQLTGKLIELNRSFQAAPDLIHGDDYQLEQVFVNLFLNATEAMGTNGSLKIATQLVASRKKSSHLRITVTDTGVGVAPENLGQLFEPFFTTKPNGTGLGLPIIRRIIQEHHGDITVQSELNSGTTFSILLPATAKPA